MSEPWTHISKMQTVMSREEMSEHIGSGCKGVHESIFRAHHILREVKRLLDKRVDAEVVLELVALMEVSHE